MNFKACSKLIDYVILAFIGFTVYGHKYKTEIPKSIIIPDKIDTRLGTLNFNDGFTDDQTVEKIYDKLDFQRSVQSFLTAIPAASLYAMREGQKSLGVNNQSVVVFEDRMDSKTLFFTANSKSVYLVGWLDLKDGPIVIETPPNVLDFLNDYWFYYVADIGNAGLDNGKGGKFLFVPPDYKGDIPKGYFTYYSFTYGNYLFLDSAWENPFIGNSYLFEHNDVRLIDVRSMFFFTATGITPAMSIAKARLGSQYAGCFHRF